MVDVSAEISDRLAVACAVFGLELRPIESAGHEPHALGRASEQIAEWIGERDRSRGLVCLLTGPSGSGKSTLLRLLERNLRARGEPVRLARPIARGSRSVLDHIPGSLDRALRTLARCGLADATVLPRTPRELSDGQRWRLGLARAFRGCRPRIVIADEFASTLDALTALGVCGALGRSVKRSPGEVLIAATARDEVERWLQPCIMARVPFPAPGVRGDVALDRHRHA